MGARVPMANARTILVATGASPALEPAVPGIEYAITSNEAFDLPELPKRLLIVGGGYIAVEFASLFARLGVQVSMCMRADNILRGFDEDLRDALQDSMAKRGIRLITDTVFASVARAGDGLAVRTKTGETLAADQVLLAIGRDANTAGLGLENAGVKLTPSGHVAVDRYSRTSAENIYAVGDVIGFPALASAAYVQGRYAAGHALGGDVQRSMLRNIPTGIYASPEISSVGRTERELTEAKIPYEIGHAQYKNLARAQITGQTAGMLKLLFHRETLEILGVHCFGANAAEIIHIGQAILSQPAPVNSLLYFINTTFNYPTMAEAYRVAALNGYNRLF